MYRKKLQSNDPFNQIIRIAVHPFIVCIGVQCGPTDTILLSGLYSAHYAVM